MRRILATRPRVSSGWATEQVGAASGALPNLNVAQHRITDHRLVPQLDLVIRQVYLEDLAKGMPVGHPVKTERAHQHVQVDHLDTATEHPFFYPRRSVLPKASSTRLLISRIAGDCLTYSP